MDLALERIERQGAGHGPADETQLSTGRSSRDSLAPLPLTAQDLTPEFDETTLSGAGAGGNAPGHSREGEQLAGLFQRLEALEASRIEVTQELGSLRDARGEQQVNATQVLGEFEAELTAALEARAKEADFLLEQRLIEVAGGLRQQLAGFEASASEDRARVAALEGDLGRRLEELEAVACADRARVTETSRSCGEALQLMKEQLAAFRRRLQLHQDEGGGMREQLVGLSQRLQQLQEDRAEVREQLEALRQRLQQQEDEGSGVPAEAERRLLRVEEALSSRIRELESGQLLSLEAERRMQRLDDSLSARIRETESGLAAVQRNMEGQVQQLQCRVDEVRHCLASDLREQERRAAANCKAEGQLEELRCWCDAELAAIRSRLEAIEARCLEETQEALRRGLEEVQARSMGATERSIVAHIDRFRAEVEERKHWEGHSVEQLDLSCTEDAPHLDPREPEGPDGKACEQSGCPGHLEELEGKQQRQDALIEKLLEAKGQPGHPFHGHTPRRPLKSLCSDGPTAAAQRSSGHTGGSESVASAVAASSAEFADSCLSRLDLLAARVAAVEEQTTTAAAEPTGEAGLTAFVAEGRAELRAALQEQLRQGVCAAEEECAWYASHLEALAARAEKGEAERRSLAEGLAAQAVRAEEAAAAAAREAARAGASAAEVAAEAAGHRPAGGCAPAEDGRATLVRLEARVELAEARQRASLQELRARVEELGRRPSSPHEPVCHEPPWALPIRELESHLKAMMAAQVEDSAAALRSVAQVVEELGAPATTCMPARGRAGRPAAARP